jgi:hypothetical protein
MSALKDLVSMGFDVSLATKALMECKGDINSALEWCLTNAPEDTAPSLGQGCEDDDDDWAKFDDDDVAEFVAPPPPISKGRDTATTSVPPLEGSSAGCHSDVPVAMDSRDESAAFSKEEVEASNLGDAYHGSVDSQRSAAKISRGEAASPNSEALQHSESSGAAQVGISTTRGTSDDAARDGPDDASHDGADTARRGPDAARDGPDDALHDGPYGSSHDGPDDASREGPDALHDGPYGSSHDGPDDASREGPDDASRDGPDAAPGGPEGQHEGADLRDGDLMADEPHGSDGENSDRPVRLEIHPSVEGQPWADPPRPHLSPSNCPPVGQFVDVQPISPPLKAQPMTPPADGHPPDEVAWADEAPNSIASHRSDSDDEFEFAAATPAGGAEVDEWGGFESQLNSSETDPPPIVPPTQCGDAMALSSAQTTLTALHWAHGVDEEVVAEFVEALLQLALSSGTPHESADGVCTHTFDPAPDGGVGGSDDLGDVSGQDAGEGGWDGFESAHSEAAVVAEGGWAEFSNASEGAAELPPEEGWSSFGGGGEVAEEEASPREDVDTLRVKVASPREAEGQLSKPRLM